METQTFDFSALFRPKLLLIPLSLALSLECVSEGVKVEEINLICKTVTGQAKKVFLLDEKENPVGWEYERRWNYFLERRKMIKSRRLESGDSKVGESRIPSVSEWAESE